jgi:hypothetical protein
MLNQVQNWPGLRIDVMANGYMLRPCTSYADDRTAALTETHVFESFEALAAHLRAYLPIYPVMQPTITTTTLKAPRR